MDSVLPELPDSRRHSAASDTSDGSSNNQLRHIPGKSTHGASQRKYDIREYQTRLAPEDIA